MRREYRKRRSRFCVKVFFFICNCKSKHFQAFFPFLFFFNVSPPHPEQQRRRRKFFSLFFFLEEMGRETGVWKRYFFFLLFAKSNTFCPGVNFTEMVCVVYSTGCLHCTRRGRKWLHDKVRFRRSSFAPRVNCYLEFLFVSRYSLVNLILRPAVDVFF